ncbi:hypothetical protein PENANT_c051G07160 [Penicillium antarcticum]|uniref:NAD-dependent epimerase/dehydratase domain-containing protein n=1 Tax=Penicillium antarcticum TaxID=416450 RepID=A0A1V6PR64_9EURO|nr:hypothetical protein PENANT_c051G07160 [Penicillium antarcticum]
MTTTPATAAVFGCTGAVGSQILATLLTTEQFQSVNTISRRLPNNRSPKLQSLQEPDIFKWADMISTLSPNPTTVFNVVGTMGNAPGGLANQWKIDHDSVIENAKAAKAAGVKTYIFISSGGTRSLLWGWVPYSRMKVGVENAIKATDFETAIVLHPGMIIAADQTVIGRAAVAAARMAEAGNAPSKYWVVEQPDIIRLGKDEWKM